LSSWSCRFFSAFSNQVLMVAFGGMQVAIPAE